MKSFLKGFEEGWMFGLTLLGPIAVGVSIYEASKTENLEHFLSLSFTIMLLVVSLLCANYINNLKLEEEEN